MYPVLHGEIGLVNAAIDCFFNVLDDKVKSMTVEEKKGRTKLTLAEIKLDLAKNTTKMQQLTGNWPTNY